MIAKVNWKPTNTDLRKFGLTLIIGFGLIGGIVFWRGGETIAKWMWIVSGSIGALGIVLPPLSRPFYVIWMGFAFVMGTIISTLILTLIFYGIFTPIGLFMRLIGRDALKLKKSSFTGGTYWSNHPSVDNKESYERLF